jgi:PAS domain S-box-containing protein
MTNQQEACSLPSIDCATMHILLVEDDAFIAITQIRQLESHKYQVTHVSSGEAAVKAVHKKLNYFSLILMDIDLGAGIDGTQAAEQILTLADVPIVFLSSHSEREIVQKTERITSYGYVVKNSGIVILDTVIKMALRLYQSHSRVLKQLKLLEQARVQLEETESKYKTLFANIEDSIFVADSESGMLIDANPKAQGLIGKSLEEIQHMHQSELHPPEMVNQVKQTFFATSNAGNKVLTREFPVIHSDGHWIPVEISAGTNLLIDGRKYHVGVFRDISDQIAMEEALRTSEALYRSIVEHTFDIIFKLDSQGVLEYLTPSWTIMLGHDVEETLGKGFAEYIHSEDLSKSWEFFNRIIESKTRQSGVRYRVRHRDGSWRWHTSSATPHMDHTGKVVGIIGNSRDIQEVVDAELAIQLQLQKRDG